MGTCISCLLDRLNISRRREVGGGTVWGILGLSLLAGMSTPLGGWLVLQFRYLSKTILALVLGLTVGIMTTVVLVDLMPMALQSGTSSRFFIGFFSGVAFLWVLRQVVDKLADKQHTDAETAVFYQMGWFIAIAIALHDLPEGIAIGAGNAVKQEVGLLIALAIAFHNIPEGMSIAAPLRLAGMPKRKIFWMTFWTGWVTPLGTLCSLGLFSISTSFVSLTLSFASGAMMYVVGHDILPQSIVQSKPFTLLGAIFGVVLMVVMHQLHV